MKAPPLLPEETLDRVLRVANADGLSVLAVSGLLTLLAASSGNVGGVAVGLLVAAAGAIELHGVGLLRAGEPRGINWVIASQPYLLTVLLLYCALQLGNVDLEPMRAAVTDDLRAKLAEIGRDEDWFLRLVHTLTYVVLAGCTVIYQSWLGLYYYRRREAVIAAVTVNDVEDLHEIE